MHTYTYCTYGSGLTAHCLNFCIDLSVHLVSNKFTEFISASVVMCGNERSVWGQTSWVGWSVDHVQCGMWSVSSWTMNVTFQQFPIVVDDSQL